MASTQEFEVTFEVVKVRTGGGSGATYSYRKGPRKARVAAASAHPKDLLAVLNADVPVGSGESIEILHVGQVATGTEGTVVLS